MLCASYFRPELMERGGGEGGRWIGLDPKVGELSMKKM